jgi:hypothetical protein
MDDDEAKRLGQRIKLLDLDVHDLIRTSLAEGIVALAGKEPIRFYQRSPFPEDSRFFAAVDMHVAKYPVDDTTKCRLVVATGKTGVVGRTRYGWLFVRDSRPALLREATEAEVKVLPHLPDDWETFLIEREVIDWNREHDAFLALLLPYDLRDGHNPAEPFTSPRDYIGRGWYGIVKELVEDLIKLGWNRQAVQVKEKHGTLRFYITQRNEEFLARIEAAREHSGEVCEVCGKGGALRVSPLYSFFTRCDSCWDVERQRLEQAS